MQQNFLNKDFRNQSINGDPNKHCGSGKSEKLTTRGNVYLAFQSNSVKLNDRHFL